MPIRVGHRHRRDVHRPGRRRRRRPHLPRQGAVDPARSRRRPSRRRSGKQAIDPADVELVVVGTTIGINAVLTRARRARPVPDHQGLRGHSVHPAHQPQAPLRLPLAQADAPRAPARLLRGHGAARRGGNVLMPLDVRGARRRARSLDVNGDHGVAVAVCLLFSYLNPEHELRVRDALERPSTRAPGFALARGRADLARVRARHHGHRRRLHEAALRRLRRRRLTALDGRGRRRQLVAPEVERRPRACRRGTLPPGASPPLRHRRRRRSAAPTSHAPRASTRRSRSTWAGRAATSA